MPPLNLTYLYTEKIMDEKEHLRVVKIKLWRYGILSIAAFIPPIFSYYCPVMPEGETLSSWFHRSGSIMVIIAIWAEYKLFSLNDYFDLHNIRVYGPIDTPKIYKSMYVLVSTIAAIGMISGTLIWGYGDVFIRNT